MYSGLAREAIIEDLYGRGMADPDSIARNFGELLGHRSRFYPQTAAYQSLGIVGVDLIVDESVRVATTRFFEPTLDRVAIAEDALWESHDQFLEPDVIEHVQPAAGPRSESRPPRGAYLHDLDALIEDASVRLIMDRIEADRGRLPDQYERAEDQLDALIDRLDAVLGS